MIRYIAVIGALVCCAPVFTSAQRRAFDMDVPRPIAAADKVWIEELTWMEIRDAIRGGKTTALIIAGSTEQNGPYVPAGKHVFVLRATAEAIARKLGNALIAPAIPFEPGNFSNVPGTIQVRDTTYDALVEDEAESLKANGFKHVILIGDSGGNQRGLERVAKKLAESWANSGTTIHYIKEYYDSWTAADAAWPSLGIPKTIDEGIHDDYSVNSIIATVDPEKIRFKQRQDAGKASINGQTLVPIEKTIENGKKLVEIRANITVDAIKKALAAFAQAPDAAQIAQERKAAEKDAPQLAEVLQLKPGMTVADIGAGGGAFTVVLGHWIGDGKVYATDIGDRQLKQIRAYAEKEGLKNVTVVQGAAAATNLPPSCCDAMFMRDVYHHITDVAAFNKSLFASLKPGGRLAILDFRPDPGSKLPNGVPVNRGGHGINPPIIEEELKAAGFTHLQTIERWPPDEKNPLFLVLFTKP